MIQEPYNQYEPYTDVVYRLEGYEINHPESESYPCFRIHHSEESFYHSLEDAQQRIFKLIEENRSTYSKWFCFYISEVPVGVNCSAYFDGQRRWSYDHKGQLVAHKKTSDLMDINGNCQIYWGREPDDCRFKVGDIVEIFDRDKVTLGIVCQLPFDFIWASARLPKDKPERPLPFHLDFSDDNYIILPFDDQEPDHFDVLYCFPAGTLHLDESVVEEMKRQYEKFMQDNEK